MTANTTQRIISVISDTHGLLRPEATAILQNSELILHAGDIHNRQVLQDLEQIAPVIAVRGNHDKGHWADDLHLIENIEIGGVTIAMVHDINDLTVDCEAGHIQIVIYGHSHKPLHETRGKTVFLNPGSAGPKRFKLPITMAQLTIVDGKATAQIIQLVPNSNDVIV